MGANLCSLRQQPSESEPRRRRIVSSLSDHDDQKIINHGSSIINFMKLDCLKLEEKINNKKKKHSPEKKTAKAKRLTLEEWLMASPGRKPESFLGGELHVFKNFSKRVCPSSKRVHADVNSGPRDSLTLERLVKVEDDELQFPSNSMSRSCQSGKLKKKVSFKLPDEADIIIFYSPEERHFEEC